MFVNKETTYLLTYLLTCIDYRLVSDRNYMPLSDPVRVNKVLETYYDVFRSTNATYRQTSAR